ncbi:MAG: bifunctional riboflavin kinase/FAD synthetase [Rhizobiaceae bacterium]|nr:bifunctional riboflavin kinase/FAD synthetase [Rhizobiaceae bacterium]
MSFLRIQSLTDFPDALKGGVVAIGNFDGVHRGHQSVLSQAVNLAKANGVPATVLTFEPHPRTFFKPDAPVFRLTDAKTKAELLGSMGFDCVVEHPFDGNLSSTPAAEFVSELLVRQFGVSHVVTGYDFHFGKGREGSPKFLMQAGEEHGFSATIVTAFSDEGGDVVSSSRIRECLATGELAEANALLGYSCRVSGKVVKGAQLGRTLGYPTANISLPPEATLAHGIYAVRAKLADGTLKEGVASYGRRPTFDNGEVLLETFIFDFSGDLYDQEITIYLESWLRGEEKFDSAEALVEQMDKDSEEASAHLGTLGPEQGLWPVIHS